MPLPLIIIMEKISGLLPDIKGDKTMLELFFTTIPALSAPVGAMGTLVLAPILFIAVICFGIAYLAR